jgi:acyl-CoA-dependent ceramide synthase
MDYFFDTNRLPSFLVPFVSLSYRVDPPPNPDSFPNSSYYDIGYLDVCLIVTIISTMAILRDATRILLFEPFANWQLTRDWRRRQALKSGSATPDSKASNVKTNGRINGPAEHSPEARRIRHSVVRFAEQGWQVVYYSWQWSLGVVRVSYHLLLEKRLLILATVHSLLSSLEPLGRVPSYTPPRHYQGVLSHADVPLRTSCPSSQR